jgi:peptidase M28-like protein/PA domain-containing protein
MPGCLTSRLARSWLVAACVAVGLLAPSAASAEPSSRACDARANDTPHKLLPCIQTDDLWNHMKAFQAIADANPGLDGHPSRNSGEPGYWESAQYVKRKMEAAGYAVRLQPYTFTYTSFVGTPTWSESSPTSRSFTLVDDWNPGSSNGTATDKQVQAAGGIIIPPTPTASSTSGCTAADFSGFTPGNIALIQRGGCNFGVKVLNATAAGASGVVIFNEGNPGRTAVVNGSMLDANNNPFVATIPVAFTSFEIGQQLYNESKSATPPRMSLDIKLVVDPNRTDWNVIAESKGGDPNHVVVVDAHLDAIYGAGMLDNASGSATILNVAEQMRKVHPRNKLRFIWFGGEELGLLGSDYYVHHLTAEELSHISYDLDADVTATPNYLIGVLDPAGPDLFSRTVSTTFPANVYEPSKIARDYGVDYLDSIDKNHLFLSPVGTDAFWFNMVGVPASGVLTGQDCCKPQSDVDLFGGQLGNFEGNLGTFDGGCVDNPFRWCDNLDNNDPEVMTFMSRTFDNMVIRMAMNNDFSGRNQQRLSRARAAMRARSRPVARRSRGKVARRFTAR